MSTAREVVEINGRAYDARTGKMLDQKKTAPKKNVVMVDGIVKRTRQPAAKSARLPQKSKTLMRPSVKKPKAEPKNETPEAKRNLPSTGATRLARAKDVQKSAHVSRFHHGHLLPKKIIKKSSALPVVEPKTRHAVQPPNMFEKAIDDATSHLETFVPAKKSSRKRRYIFASTIVVSLLAIGFLAYATVPALKVKYAGTRAGFSASLPSYNPAGFGLNNNVSSSSGEVALTYDSRTDDKSYKITQSPNNWNSQALLSNYVIPTYGANNYQIYESGGKTIYIIDNSNATWVDGGVWYRLEGNATLTSDQLQRIVNSL